MTGGGAGPLLEVGRVTRPHGLRGEVVVDLATNRLERLQPGSVLMTDGGDLEVVSARPQKGKWVVAFAGIDTVERAGLLRGVTLRAEPLDDPEALWVHDLIGAEVVDVGGESRGRVVTVEANPASDLLVLDGGGLVPLTFVVTSEPGRVVIDPPAGLFEVS